PHAPARGPAKFLFTFAILKLDSARARKVLPEEMGCSRLDRFAILHHCLYRHCPHRTWKTFALRFFAGKNWHGQMVPRKTLIKIENQFRFCAGFPFRFMNSVAFLPKKLGRAQKQAWTDWKSV